MSGEGGNFFLSKREKDLIIDALYIVLLELGGHTPGFLPAVPEEEVELLLRRLGWKGFE